MLLLSVSFYMISMVAVMYGGFIHYGVDLLLLCFDQILIKADIRVGVSEFLIEQ